jgi:hypothetical protein
VDSREMSWHDGLVLAPLLAVIVFLALYPQGALKRSESSASTSVAAAHTALSAPLAPVAASELQPVREEGSLGGPSKGSSEGGQR